MYNMQVCVCVDLCMCVCVAAICWLYIVQSVFSCFYIYLYIYICAIFPAQFCKYTMNEMHTESTQRGHMALATYKHSTARWIPWHSFFLLFPVELRVCEEHTKCISCRYYTHKCTPYNSPDVFRKLLFSLCIIRVEALANAREFYLHSTCIVSIVSIEYKRYEV